jgi:hypothetical protein
MRKEALLAFGAIAAVFVGIMTIPARSGAG